MVEMTPFEKFTKVYQKSDVIFEEKSPGSEMYIIRSGKVKVSTTTPRGETVLAILGPGEFFGEMALVDAAPRSGRATAEEDNTQLMVLDQEKFLYLIQQQPAFALTIMHTLCQRIRRRDLLYLDLLERTAEKGGLPE
jgi:CRP/FNR family cyclic AMP-dependent transcriptional regulator